jgi:hypothetical protein
MALRSSSSNGATGSTAVSVPVPAGVTAGDIVILVYTADASTVSVTLPSGFTSLAKQANWGQNVQSAEVSWKRASGSDSGTYSWGGTSGGDWAVQAFTFDGRDPGNPPVASAAKIQSTYVASPTVFTANALATSAGDDLLFLGVPDVGNSGPDALTAPSTGFSAVIANTQFGFGILGSAEQDNAPGGSVTASATFGTGTVVQSWLAWLVRIPELVAVTYTDAPSGGMVSSGSLTDALTHSSAITGGAQASGARVEALLRLVAPLAHATSAGSLVDALYRASSPVAQVTAGGSVLEVYHDGAISLRVSLVATDTGLLIVTATDVALLALAGSDDVLLALSASDV